MTDIDCSCSSHSQTHYSFLAAQVALTARNRILSKSANAAGPSEATVTACCLLDTSKVYLYECKSKDAALANVSETTPRYPQRWLGLTVVRL